MLSLSKIYLIGVTLLSAIQTITSEQPSVIRLKKHSEGYNKPVAIVDAKDGKRKLYIVERGGTIKIVKRLTGKVRILPFLNVTASLGDCEGYCEERGLLGLVFHPNYKINGYFYINYTSQDSKGVLRTIVSRFSRNATRPNFADETSELIMQRFEQPYSNHNAGDLHFGPDGYLYITSGDGGWFGDPDNLAQNLLSPLGKLLRIDVDQTSPGRNYTIPPTNPFVSDPNALSEIWAYGLRNPWKISFDRDTGDLFIADVGQFIWEEIDFQPSTSTGGENYGWRLMEGNHCYDPATNCIGNETLTMPVIEYSHDHGACSVTGGYMYRGRQKSRRGSYYFGDYCNGTIWAGTMDTSGTFSASIVKKTTGLFISSFGEDILGEVYVADIISGGIYKILKCKDSKTFFYNGNTAQTCKWIKQQTTGQVDALCGETEVFENCKQTCNNPTC